MSVRPYAWQVKPIRCRLGLATTLLVLGCAHGPLGLAQDKLAQQGPRSEPQVGSYSIQGIIKLVDCNAAIGDVQIKAAGRTARPEANPNKEFEYLYSFVGLKLARGQSIVVTPELPASRCAGGRWSPPSRTISTGQTVGIARQDFTFIGTPRTASIAWHEFSDNFNLILQLIQIRLNNYASGGSFIKLDLQPLASFEEKFDIPAIPVPGIIPGAIYINDINNDRVLSGATADTTKLPFTIKLNLVFEAGGGDEIKVTGPVPDINIKRMELSTVLTLEPYAASISYKRLRTEFTARTQVAGGWDNPMSIEQKLKPVVEKKVSDFLDQPQVRGAVAKRMRDFLRSKGIDGGVVSTAFGRDNSTGARFLRIRYVPFES